MPVMGLENFKLTPASFLRLANRRVVALVNLRTYELTPAVRRLKPADRLPYMSARVDQWIRNLYRLHPKLTFQDRNGAKPRRNVRRWSQLPSTLTVQGRGREILALSKSPGVSSVYVTGIDGHRPRRSAKKLTWYCVRAFVLIRVEAATSGNQNTEDRFVLVRASSFEDAKKRLNRHWPEYATPYLNSDGEMVSWSLDKVIDVYDTGETEIDPRGTEVYSKLGQRRMRRQYIWKTQN
jgi:Domain of unknown function (DUF4288)